MNRIRRTLESAIFYTLIVACVVTARDDLPKKDPELEAMVDDFAVVCDAYGFECSDYRERPSISWGKINSFDTLGVCRTAEIMGINFSPTIVISNKVRSLSPQEIRTIVYHELIHCYFFIDHHPGSSPHIMNPHALSKSEIDELGGVEKILNDFFIEYKSNKGLYDTL